MDVTLITYIAGTAGAVWHALTDPEDSRVYWAHRNVSDWRRGSAWEHRRDDTGAVSIGGTVLDSEPPARLVLSWAAPGENRTAGPSRVTFDIAPLGQVVRLTVTHGNLIDEWERDTAAATWPAILDNLKTFVETGRPLPTAPWLADPTCGERLFAWRDYRRTPSAETT